VEHNAIRTEDSGSGAPDGCIIKSPPGMVDSRLLTLARLAKQAGAEWIAGEAKALAERVVEGRFYVACLGQFKRGKSSLLNALLGVSLLPVGVVPITSAVTVVRFGARTAVRVRFSDGHEDEIDATDLAAFVSEEGNPSNHKAVAVVELFVPSSLLESGMCLVDTPGLGSVFEGNTAVTQGFVPHIDAALVVLGADPPISADELALVEKIATHAPELIFVLSKADRLPDSERRQARAFAERILAQKLGRPVAVLEVSASEQVTGTGPARDWQVLRDRLVALAKQSGANLVHAAEERGAQNFAKGIIRELTEHRDALLRPLEESQRRLDDLRACVAEAERSLGDLAFLFDAEESRLAAEFARWAAEFLRRALPDASEQFRRALDARESRGKLSLRPDAFAAAQEIYLRVLSPWLPDAQRAAEALYVEASEQFVKLANDFLDRLASSGDAALSDLPRSIGHETGFRVKSRLFYTELWGLTGRGLVVWLADLLRPQASVRRAVEQDVGAYLERIVKANASRIQGDFRERLRESRWRMQAEIKALLKNISASAERALGRARERRAAGAEAVQTEISGIERLLQETEALVPRQR
jgi:GTP-binding protein EngB required for normal cell division